MTNPEVLHKSFVIRATQKWVDWNTGLEKTHVSYETGPHNTNSMPKLYEYPEKAVAQLRSKSFNSNKTFEIIPVQIIRKHD